MKNEKKSSTVIGKKLVDSNGSIVGEIKDIYSKGPNDQSGWVSFFNQTTNHIQYLPLTDARISDDYVEVPYVVNGPSMEMQSTNSKEENETNNQKPDDSQDDSSSQSINARVQTYVVVKNKTITVPIREEHARLVFDSDPPHEMEGGELLKNREIDVILSREEPIVQKVVVTPSMHDSNGSQLENDTELIEFKDEL